MKVYLFGNEDLEEDNLAFKVARKLSAELGVSNEKISDLEFVIVKPNEDLPFVGEKNVVLMDTVQGLEKVQLLENLSFGEISLFPRFSTHDFDLGFQLKYLKKLGKLGEIKIIGLPQNGKVDYSLIHSILRKLVAQDIQGS